jgi:hypothetical protein
LIFSGSLLLRLEMSTCRRLIPNITPEVAVLAMRLTFESREISMRQGGSVQPAVAGASTPETAVGRVVAMKFSLRQGSSDAETLRRLCRANLRPELTEFGEGEVGRAIVGVKRYEGGGGALRLEHRGLRARGETWNSRVTPGSRHFTDMICGHAIIGHRRSELDTA